MNETLSIADSMTIHSGQHSLFVCARAHRMDLVGLTHALRNTHMNGIRAALAWFGLACPRRRDQAIRRLAITACVIAGDGADDVAREVMTWEASDAE